MNRIIILGDLLPMNQNLDDFQNGNAKQIFGEELCYMIKEADFSICNLEGPLTENDTPILKSGANLKASRESVHGLKQLGINCVALANNHIMDFGEKGLRETLDTLSACDIHNIGAVVANEKNKSYAEIELSAKKIILYNVAETEFNIPTSQTSGVNIFEEYRVCSEIQNLKDRCDYLIVLYHGGAEKYRFPSPKLKKRFHLLADCGADLVISQHSHCIGTEELYNGARLLYGQGNFCFARAEDEYTNTGLLVEISIVDSSIDVKYVKLRREKDYVRIDAEQNFDDFYERSRLVYDDEWLQRSFEEFCFPRLSGYILNLGLYGELLGFLFRIKYKYLKSSFRKNDQSIINSINTIRCEVHQEVLLTALDTFSKRIKDYN